MRISSDLEPARTSARISFARILSFVKLTKRQELIVNVGWKAASASTPVDEELVHVMS
jgi:hypothetical protein